MATSQNGWPVLTYGTHPNLVAIPKIMGRVRKGAVETIFKDLVTQYDKYVEDVDKGRDDWGYAYRPIRGQSSGYSNHASGTAIDINALIHPRGKKGTFTAAQKAAVRKILARYDGVIRWGEDYTIGKVDGMHFEINANATRVNAVAKKLKGGIGDIKPVGNPKPTQPKPTTPGPVSVVYSKLSESDAKSIQKYLQYTKDYSGTADGKYGQMTKDAVLKYQKRQRANGCTHLVADGYWGTSTQKHMEWVKKVQKATSKWAASQRIGSLPEDGDYGALTVRHVKAVQSANGKKPNGAYYKNGGRIADGIAGPIYCKTIGVSAKP